MANDMLLKVADVLDELASSMDNQEVEKQAAVKTVRDSTLKSITTRYAELSGGEIPEDVLSKLASADEGTLSAVHTLIEKKANSVDSLGGPSERPSSGRTEPKNKKEAAQRAWDDFGNFLTS